MKSSRMPNGFFEHELLIWRKYFRPLIGGVKTFEIRKHDPHAVLPKQNDVLHLIETFDGERIATGASCKVLVLWCLYNTSENPTPNMGLEFGYYIMAIELIPNSFKAATVDSATEDCLILSKSEVEQAKGYAVMCRNPGERKLIVINLDENRGIVDDRVKPMANLYPVLMAFENPGKNTLEPGDWAAIAYVKNSKGEKIQTVNAIHYERFVWEP